MQGDGLPGGCSNRLTRSARPTTERIMNRQLTKNERIRARHLLQELSEQAKSIRNAMDPLHGIMYIDHDMWEEQWNSLKKELDYFTEITRN